MTTIERGDIPLAYIGPAGCIRENVVTLAVCGMTVHLEMEVRSWH